MLGDATPVQGTTAATSVTWRNHVFAFLEAKTHGGSIYEGFTILLIVLNVLAFIIGSLFIEEYNNKDNDAVWASRQDGICGNVCDGLFFGNYEDNMLGFLNLGSTSVLEILTVAVFSVDYLLRVYLADLENPKFSGLVGRLLYLPTFYSLVDLASTVPFYVDSFLLRNTNIAASQVRLTLCTCPSVVAVFVVVDHNFLTLYPHDIHQNSFYVCSVSSV